MINASLAQLVEQLICIQQVVSSNLTGSSTFASLAQSVEQLTFNQLVRGSSPRQPTIVGARRPRSMRAFFRLNKSLESIKKTDYGRTLQQR